MIKKKFTFCTLSGFINIVRFSLYMVTFFLQILDFFINCYVLSVNFTNHSCRWMAANVNLYILGSSAFFSVAHRPRHGKIHLISKSENSLNYQLLHSIWKFQDFGLPIGWNLFLTSYSVFDSTLWKVTQWKRERKKGCRG